MEILASVDESDIGQIKQGQTARFTVQAYADELFEGVVRQVRLQSTTQENVVNYTVVVDVTNENGLLLPGMTAIVDFLIETAQDVLKIPNAALRFRPTEAMMAQVQARREERRQEGADSLRTVRGGVQSGESGRPGGFGGAAQGGFGDGARGGFGGSQDFTALWFFGEDGMLSMAPARIGISDGQVTESRAGSLKPACKSLPA